MKQVLIIDETALFREYLREKLRENDIETLVGINAIDGISKMRNQAPDLLILDYHLSKQGASEVLKQKKANPNTVNTPVIILAQHIDQKRLIELVPYNVKKVFTKPVKIDLLFETLSELLGVSFSIDESPGIVEVHVNDDIIFIEIAQGLNWDKLDLLRFKILELMGLYDIRVPKVIIMISDIKLGFADALNLEKLLNTVLQASGARLRRVRILTRDDFVRQFIAGRKEYADIEVVSNLQYAMDDLLGEPDRGKDRGGSKAELISDRVLSVGAASGGQKESMVLKFDTEERGRGLSLEEARDLIRGLRIAVIDDDPVILEAIQNTFGKTGASVTVFAGGEDYLGAAGGAEFDLMFLDLMMPGTDGFEVLRILQARNIGYPVIVISAITQRETVIRAFQMGVKSYLIKPLKADDLFKKSMEILKANF
ncbi:MAG: response regulator [Treponema sp.]|jgi:DNA-binding response OmpR family regulator|nr:response regulator [Treponema sp.]